MLHVALEWYVLSGLQAYSFASDVWSLGLSIVECLKGALPFDTSPTKENKGDFFALALSVNSHLARTKHPNGYATSHDTRDPSAARLTVLRRKRLLEYVE